MNCTNLIGLINNTNYTDDMNIKIGMYSGSFDPPHNGHLEVIDKMFELNLCDYVFVFTAHKNKNKPKLLDYYRRSIMITNMIDTYQNEKKINKIFFVEDNLKEAIDLLKTNSNFYLVGIVGSDFYNNFFARGLSTSLKFHEWIVIPRNDFIIKSNVDADIKKYKLNLKIKLLDESIFCKQHLSSSYIKKFEKYDELCQRNKEYILEQKLYG